MNKQRHAQPSSTRALVSGMLAIMAIGCRSASFSLGPPPQLGPVPDAQVPTQPTSEPDLPSRPAESVELQIHASRNVPDLRGQLVALTRFAADPLGGRLEQDLTIGLLEHGVARLIPGSALGEVDGSIDRAEAGAARGTVKLTAKLSVLSLVSAASAADFVAYGEATAGAAAPIEVGYRIPDAALNAYRTEQQKYAAAFDGEIHRTQAECSEARSRFEAAMKAFIDDGGKVGLPEPESVAASMGQQAYSAFAAECSRRIEELNAKRQAAAGPDALVQAASSRRASVSSGAEITAVIKLRDSKTDETFWIGIFRAHAPDEARAARALAARIVTELSAKWPAQVTPPEAGAPQHAERGRRAP